MWTLESARDFLQRLERQISPSWHCALGGGVLYRGTSNHDLDVILIPHSTTEPVINHKIHDVYWDVSPIYEAMRFFGFERSKTADEMKKHWESKGGGDTKHVEVWLDGDNRRVDLIIWPVDLSG